MGPRRCRSLASVPPVLLLVAAAGAQERQAMTGRVVDAVGAPAPGATVTLVEDDQALAGIDPVDVVRATSDERGRFTAELLRGVRYTGFAIGPERDGTAFCSKPSRALGCGTAPVLELRARGQRRTHDLAPARIFGDLASMRLVLEFDGCPGFAIDVPIAADGTIEAPPAAAVATAVLLGKDGALLTKIFVPSDERSQLMVWPPTEVKVAVLGDTGWSGTEVALELQETDWSLPLALGATRIRRGPAAIVDARGLAVLPLDHYADPFETPPDTRIVLATRPGCADAASGWIGREPFRDWSIVDRHARQRLTFSHEPAEPLRGTLDPAFAGRTVRVRWTGHVVQDKDGMHMQFFVQRSRDVPVAADGSYALSGVRADAAWLQVHVPPVAGRRVVTLPAPGGSLPSFTLADCAPWSLQVLDENGGPVTDATLVLVPKGCPGNSLQERPALMLDRAGRADALLQRGSWTLLASSERAFAVTSFDDWPAEQPLVLRLEPMPLLRVRVLDAEGAPLAGARFEPGSFRIGPPLPGLTGEAMLLHELGWNGLGWLVRSVQTDERGEATLRWLPWPTTVPKVFSFADSHRRRSDDFALGEQEDVLVVKVPR